uniref:Phosphodiesterase n=1 Tax=Timema douglasi TaxID=61478 RepID=A0A7R8VMR0_TIMDO|nr:unnamed protein product [Timema douglasi]
MASQWCGVKSKAAEAVESNKEIIHGQETMSATVHTNIKSTDSFSLTSLLADEASRRVIAPYVKTFRRSELVPSPEKREFSYYLQKKPISLLQNVSAFISSMDDLISVLHETADVLKVVTDSSGATLYMVDSLSEEITLHSRYANISRYDAKWKIETGRTLAAHVAFKKENVMVDDIIGDQRFPEGIGWRGTTVKAIMCVPVVTPEEDCIAVIELFKEVDEGPYKKTDLQIVVATTGWMGAAINQHQQKIALQKQQELNDYLLGLCKHYFADHLVVDKIISEIMMFAKETIGAERGSFFIIDQESDELVADLFDDGDEKMNELQHHKKTIKIRFSKERGIAGLVARTGQTVNIKDAYKDERFNTEVDTQTGFITRSILCVPIMGRDGILGVVQLLNKKNASYFTNLDEQIFNTFSIYCALAVHYSNLQKEMDKISLQNGIQEDMLKLNTMFPCSHDMERLLSSPFPKETPIGFETFEWYPLGYEDQMCFLSVYMLVNICGDWLPDMRQTCEFVLKMKKGYRSISYHNFEHAFCATHCMYNILKRNMEVFTPLERNTLIIACFGHDVDHEGFTNNFLRLTNHYLYQLYPESSLENHHFHTTMFIIRSCNLFTSLPEKVFKELQHEINDAIIATDLIIYYQTKVKLLQILDGKEFNFTSATHRRLMKNIMMTTSDLSGQAKSFFVAKKICDGMYKEYYQQGDIEKKRGLCPLDMLDRDKQEHISDDQHLRITRHSVKLSRIATHSGTSFLFNLSGGQSRLLMFINLIICIRNVKLDFLSPPLWDPPLNLSSSAKSFRISIVIAFLYQGLNFPPSTQATQHSYIHIALVAPLSQVYETSKP